MTTLAPGIDAVNMTPESALREYGVLTLRSELVARALLENRAVRSFLNAVPGLDAYAILGKAWWHTTERVNGRPRYDLTILDGPASGHAALMLRIPGAILAAMPKGPLAPDARAIDDLLRDPVRAALVIVTLPEELPAREAGELAAALRELRLPLGPLVVNAVPSEDATAPALTPILDRAAATDRRALWRPRCGWRSPPGPIAGSPSRRLPGCGATSACRCSRCPASPPSTSGPPGSPPLAGLVAQGPRPRPSRLQ